MTDHISTAEAAQRLGISPQRVRVLINQGRLVALKIGRTHVVELASVTAYTPRPEGRPGHIKE
jgi:excisionase family DNA binding protein